MNPLEDRVEQFPRVFPVLEKAVEDKAQPSVELDPVGTAEQEITHHEGCHMDEGRTRRLESGEPLKRRIAFAAKPQDLAVKELLAWEVPEQQRLRNSRRLGEFFGGRPSKPLMSKQRYCRCDDRLAAFVAV